MGTSSQTPIQTLFLIKKYYAQFKPKVVLWEVWPNIFGIDGVESMSDLISNMENPLELKNMMLSANSMVAYNTLIASAIHNVVDGDKSFVEPEVKEEDRYVRGGYVEREVQYLEDKRDFEFRGTFLPEQVAAFEEALQFLHREGVKVYLIQAPCTSFHVNNYENNQEMDQFFMTYVNNGLAEKYLNFNNKELPLVLNDSLDFYDTHHMNQNGVVKFNTVLLQDPMWNSLEVAGIGYNQPDQN